jgi:hypothetical protein
MIADGALLLIDTGCLLYRFDWPLMLFSEDATPFEQRACADAAIFAFAIDAAPYFAALPRVFVSPPILFTFLLSDAIHRGAMMLPRCRIFEAAGCQKRMPSPLSPR